VTALPAEAVQKDRRRLRVHDAAIGDRIYEIVTTTCALIVPALVIAIALAVFAAAWPAFAKLGLSIVTSSNWDVGAGQFGAAPALYGTLVSSAVALIIATPLAIGVAIFLSEFSPVWLRQPIGFLVDLLAAVPSVVYGLWGIFVLVPMLREHVMPFLRDRLHLGLTPLFSGPAYGPSMLAAGVVVAVMALP
jgi:phosphate transport system permease protein